MLQNLHVRNLALIDNCEIELTEGLNILTGETGAGKSIIIGSVNLALGEKVSKEMLRDKEQPAYVELVFSVEDPEIAEAIKALDIEMEDDHTVILSRRITPQRAIGRINGEAASVSKMKAAAALLIDVHGQHEHQSLLTRRNHLKILDEFADRELSGPKKLLAEAYHSYRRLKEEYDASNMDSEQRARELSFLEYEVEEIEEAALVPGEDEELEQLYKLLANGQKILSAVGTAYEELGRGADNASDRLNSALREISSVSGYDPQLLALTEQLTEIDNLLTDFNHELSSYMADAEFDEETLYNTEKRLDLINHLKTKYGRTIEDILAALEEKRERIRILNDYDAYLEKLSVQLSRESKKLQEFADQVSAIRRRNAEVLIPSITEALRDLNFLDVRFSMDFSAPHEITANGYDDPEFMISTNPGEELRPLGKVASGGELSRIMLAIKTVMAENDHIDSLIFDEIDSGISGRTAQMVSQKMSLLGRKHQVICITHLPQIAAMADSHYLIEKGLEGSRTVSHIHRLSEEDSVHELARMLGGVEITETVVENAREMKLLAGKIK